MSDAVRLWDICAGLLREQVSDPVWHTAFEGIRAVDYDGQTLTLGVPSPLAKERIEGRYLGLVRDALVERSAGNAVLRPPDRRGPHPRPSGPSTCPTARSLPQRPARAAAPTAWPATAGALDPPVPARRASRSTPATPSRPS